MPVIDTVQEQIDETQVQLADTLDNVQSAIDKAQAKLDSTKDKLDTKLNTIYDKIKYSIDWVNAVVETSGLAPSNLFNIAKVLTGQKVATKPVVVPLLPFSIVAFQFSKRPSKKEMQMVIEATIAANNQ